MNGNTKVGPNLVFYDDKEGVKEAIAQNEKMKFLAKRTAANRKDPYFMIK